MVLAIDIRKNEWRARQMQERAKIKYNENEFSITGNMYRFGKEAHGLKCSIKRYKDEEQSQLEVTHHNYTADTGKPIYWLKSHGLISWGFITA
jgi:hypothetical protein